VKANALLEQFQLQMEALARESNWRLLRYQEGHSDRAFELVNHPHAPFRFIVKVSQSSPGFWGLGIERAASMIELPGEYLVLLEDDDDGYLINPVRLRALIKTFSRDAMNHDYKINEPKVRREQRFRSLEELWDLILSKLPTP